MKSNATSRAHPRMQRRWLAALSIVLFSLAHAEPIPANAKGPRQTMTGKLHEVQWGFASFYDPRLHGRRTSTGDQYDKHDLTGAHPNLPLGTVVKVTNRNNARSVIVEINDRLPPMKRRVIDLSSAAARKLGMLARGIVPVLLEVVGDSERH